MSNDTKKKKKAFRVYEIMTTDQSLYKNYHDLVLKYTPLSSNAVISSSVLAWVCVWVSLVEFPSSQCAAPQGLSVVWHPMLGYLTCTLKRVPSAHMQSLYLSRPSLKYSSPPWEVLGMRDGLNITEPFRTMLFSCVWHGNHTFTEFNKLFTKVVWP